MNSRVIFSQYTLLRIIGIVVCLLSCNYNLNAQGYNHQWLLGSYNFFQDPKGRIIFDANNYSLINENRKMVFKGTEANICDANGNLLMSSNGVWIANASGDTMMNGSGLNPVGFTSSWPYGLPMIYNNIILPYPDDTNKYVLFHHTGTFNGSYYSAYEIFYTVIDMNLDGGLGAVISKNNIAIQDTFAWGLSACHHANGRDWWIVAIKDNSDLIFKMLLTPSGITSITTQPLGVLPTIGASVQLTFSQDGKKFLCALTDGGIVVDHHVRILDFDRCSGMFSNPQVVDLSPGGIGWGLAFSASGNYAYACSSTKIFQIDVNTLSVDTVATYDGFISPPNLSCCQTSFWGMYLAANGKIYVTSGSSVEHLHEINYPDSAGQTCDVQQHAINLGYAQLRAVPNHPNYYLGCDTIGGCTCLTYTSNFTQHNFRLRIYPNPVTSNNLSIGYLLPQNSKGSFQIFDTNGKIVFSTTLPPWSNEQSFILPNLSNGVYNCIISSSNHHINKRMVILK